MITVYTLTYNEEVLIQFMIDHYRTRFPGCRIVVYDNLSTDNTVKIALANDCKVIPFDTNNQFQDRRHQEIKNSCWKIALTDWVLICDMDELLDINAKELKAEENAKTTIIRSEGYMMINLKDNLNLAGMKYGIRDANYDKSYLFNKRFINEINYSIGCHGCNPIGTITYSAKRYKAYHYASICENFSIEKRNKYQARISPENLKNGWGSQYFSALTPEQAHNDHLEERSMAARVR